MIQRIQTIYLIVVIALSSLYFFLPFCEYSLTDSHYTFKISGVKSVSQINNKTFVIPSNTIPLLLIVALITIISLIAVFSFKKRLFQIKLGRFNLLLNTLLIVLVFYNADQWAEILKVNPDYGLAMLIPVVAIVFTFFANRAIRKDEELVKSADRLR